MNKSKKMILAGAIAALIIIACIVGALMMTSNAPRKDTSYLAEVQNLTWEKGLPDWIDERAANEQTRGLIEQVNNRDWDAIAKRYSTKLGISASDITEQVKQAGPILDRLGAFESFGAVGYMHASSNDDEFVLVEQIATYENGKAAFDLSFGRDGDIVSFHIR